MASQQPQGNQFAQLASLMQEMLAGRAGAAAGTPAQAAAPPPAVTPPIAGTNRDSSDLFRQFQLRRGSPDATAQAPPSSGAELAQSLTAQPPQTSMATPDMAMLAQAMSLPLAASLLRNMQGAPVAQAPVVAPPAAQATPFGTGAAGSPAFLLQMMQQMQQMQQLQQLQQMATLAAGAVQPQALQQNLMANMVAPPVVPAEVPAPPVVAPPVVAPPVAVPAVAPAAPTTGTAESDAAKALIIQLTQQLQRSGQLPVDDSIQRALSVLSGAAGAVKTEPVAASSSQPATLPADVAAPLPHGVIANPLARSAEVYIDVAGPGISSGVSSTRQSAVSETSEAGQDIEEEEDADQTRAKTKKVAAKGKPKASEKAEPKKSGRTPARESKPSASEKSSTAPPATLRSLNRDAGVSSSPGPSRRLASNEVSMSPGSVYVRQCTVRLVQLATERDRRGNLILTRKEQERVKQLVNPRGKAATPATSSRKSSAYSRQGMSTASEAGDAKPVVNRPADGTPSKPFSEPRMIVGGSKAVSLLSAGAVGETREPMGSLSVSILASINSSQGQQLRSMYMGMMADNMEWLSLVTCTRADAKGKRTRLSCQCIFCPAMGDLPRDIATHIRSKHAELLFALNKLKASTGPLLYVNCRHCDFVTVEPTVLWIHFEVYHGVPGILDACSHPDVDVSAPLPLLNVLKLDDNVSSVTSYVCFDCAAVSADSDTNLAATQMARHVVKEHPESPNYNGCFVKLMMLQRVEGDPDSISGTVTYRQAIYDAMHSRGRREVFVCMLCRYSAYCPYSALSHNLTTHQSKRLLFQCDDCSYQCTTDADIVNHTNNVHRPGQSAAPIVTSATLVDKDGDSFVECKVTGKRESGIIYVETQTQVPAAAPKNENGTGTNPTSTARGGRKRARAQTDESDEDSDYDVTSKKTKKKKTQKKPAKAKPTKRGRRSAVNEDTDEDSTELQSTAVSSTADNMHTTSAAQDSSAEQTTNEKKEKSDKNGEHSDEAEKVAEPQATNNDESNARKTGELEVDGEVELEQNGLTTEETPSVNISSGGKEGQECDGETTETEQVAEPGENVPPVEDDASEDVAAGAELMDAVCETESKEPKPLAEALVESALEPVVIAPLAGDGQPDETANETDMDTGDGPQSA